MNIIFFDYGLESKASDGFPHYWCTLITALELSYKKSIYSSTGKTPEILEKVWNPKLPYDTLRNYLVDINPTARSSKIMLDKSRRYSNRCMKDSLEDAKERWEKSNNPPVFK
ncbi:hypothetical protein O181_111063 [Austropuccinia psidii MF-1]|uniref:Uncharacterized protein n=1 Tax=Austropuccinia psidii MF-1 TaxID=1389203 RepID=A0A9Q3JYV7_9BASI|nr:hypothetical protein [Austropuccinia psidii MF-1]